MTTLLIFLIVFISVTSLVAGTLVLLGKFDNYFLKNAAKNGTNVNIALQRKIIGIVLLSDSVVVPAMVAAIYYLCE